MGIMVKSQGRVTLPSYSYDRFRSPPVNIKYSLGGLCNVPINSLTLCELTPERLLRLIEYLRLLNYSLSLVLGLPPICILSIRDDSTSGSHLVYHVG